MVNKMKTQPVGEEEPNTEACSAKEKDPLVG